ncbi:MAG TPA: YeeE/YedE thiosulfate transporter family protein, partial [Pseudolabrys sp.]|nr:YeeE/YedE thiosulfate transporter family protein [Pseudolabrys sp.]
SRTMVLLGRGNLRSLVVIATIGITAQMTLKGLIAPLRIALVNGSQTTFGTLSFPAVLAHSGLAPALAASVAALIVAAAFLVYAFSHASFRNAALLIASGIAMGLLVPAGWFVTGFLGNDPFTPVPVASLTFIAPLADSLQYVMLSTGSTVNFGIVVMGGVLLGSFITAVVTRRFELEGYKSHNHMLRSIGGAAMMGAGGVMAFGCSIGQGLTGLSTLALPSAIAVAGILIGATVGLRSPVRVPALASA